jgi:hypothetical protein
MSLTILNRKKKNKILKLKGEIKITRKDRKLRCLVFFKEFLHHWPGPGKKIIIIILIKIINLNLSCNPQQHITITANPNSNFITFNILIPHSYSSLILIMMINIYWYYYYFHDDNILIWYTSMILIWSNRNLNLDFSR